MPMPHAATVTGRPQQPHAAPHPVPCFLPPPPHPHPQVRHLAELLLVDEDMALQRITAHPTILRMRPEAVSERMGCLAAILASLDQRWGARRSQRSVACCRLLPAGGKLSTG